ncbi:MAG: LysR family transcriptional regulator [Gammaproteobacteria bacterium]|nr:MAG: LysR family transcriptional regulator [Gammaproteobacteria bacterium]
MVKKAILGQLDDVDIRRLRVFRVVTEAGGISAAELELNIGRSTISTHIKDLEIRLGVTLCRRGRSGFSLTEEGSYIYKATLRLLASLDEFRAEVSELNQHLSGQLNIALFDKIATNPEAHIDRAFKHFDAIAPDVKMTIYVESLNEIEQGVMEGRFQVGVIPSHRVSPSLSYQPIFNEHMKLYCGKEHQLFGLSDSVITKQDILNCKYAGLGYHSPNMEIGRKLGMQREVTVYDQEAIVHLLLSGCYLGYLPDHYADNLVEQGLIRAIGTKVFFYECEFLVINRSSPKPSRIVQTFLDCLTQAHI